MVVSHTSEVLTSTKRNNSIRNVNVNVINLRSPSLSHEIESLPGFHILVRIHFVERTAERDDHLAFVDAVTLCAVLERRCLSEHLCQKRHSHANLVVLGREVQHGAER